MKVAVIGANGQLGSDICIVFKEDHEVIELSHSDVEITNIDQLGGLLRSLKPQLVINTAAYHNVPKCEENPNISFGVNSQGVLNLAKLSMDVGFTLVHYSTDYVFDGLKKEPYIEDDKPNPLNVYGNTKYSGELFIQNYCNKYFVVRVSGIYGRNPCRAKGGNFITTMIRASQGKPEVKVVNDEILTPTPTMEIAKNTSKLIQNGSYGLYHMTCEGQCSWFEFAKLIFETLNIGTPLVSCSVHDTTQTLKRPLYSVLENRHLKIINKNIMPYWRNALREYLTYYYC